MVSRCNSEPRRLPGRPNKKTTQVLTAPLSTSLNLPAGDSLKSALRYISFSSPEVSPKKVLFNRGGDVDGTLPTPPPTVPRRNPSRQANNMPTIPSTSRVKPMNKSTVPDRLDFPFSDRLTNSKSSRSFSSDNLAKGRQSVPEPSEQPFTTAEDQTKVLIPDHIIEKLSQELGRNPKNITLETIHLMLHALQKNLRSWTESHFKHELSQNEIAAFPLAELPTQYPEFLRVTQYIADGSQYSWRNFLTSKDTRPHLVYAIISEFLKHHVFGATCFGLNYDELDKLAQIDILYINWDGFVRTKERARLLMNILQAKPREKHRADVDHAIHRLVSDLSIVLEPLMPNCSSSERSHIISELDAIVDGASTLHLCIRLSGFDGTIVSFRSSTKGDIFVPTARQNCINPDFVRKTECHAPGPNDRIVIKLPCFPLVTAVVPYGSDLKDYVDAQLQYNPQWQETDPIDPRIVEFVNQNLWCPFPEDLQHDVLRDQLRKAPVQNCIPKNPTHGSYVKMYSLNTSDVYCEWTPLSESAIIAPEWKLTLQQAIQKAWNEKHANDSLLTEWNARVPFFIKLSVSGTVLAGLTAAAIKCGHKNLVLDLAEMIKMHVHIPTGEAGYRLLVAVKSYLAQVQARLQSENLNLKAASEQVRIAARLAIERFFGLSSSITTNTMAFSSSSNVLKPMISTARVHKRTIVRTANKMSKTAIVEAVKATDGVKGRGMRGWWNGRHR